MRRLRSFLSLATALLAGCSDPAPAAAAPVCLDAGIDEACSPAFEPTYQALYANTFQASCVSTGVSCHTARGKQGGVDFSDPDAAYDALLATKVRPGDAACSVLVQRVLSTSGKTRMPPGRSLTAGEQCAIVKWVAEGARR